MSIDTKKAEELFERALDFEPDQRQAFLVGACGNDVNLRRRIEDLLIAHEAKAGFLPEQTGDSIETVLSPAPLTEKAGCLIDRYKLLEKLGEGGFGAVWAAEQREPVKRRVALKVIKLGMDTNQVVARFEAERQALALMDHPNIAKVLDAGATDAGRPYFVMELVKGIPITKYCDQEKLSTEQSLDLFIKVCHAIQHAHQKGIIHRDIKPSNILVTLHDGIPVPKVIDFGIAKATQQELTEKTIYTRFNQVIGTPAYMSPEQAEMSGLDVDTRSDIYSLGVLLYELLTGSTPFDTEELMKSGWDQMRKIIREREPVRPSTRLRQSELSSPPTGPSRVPRHSSVSSDLDWIVMKCLEKDRTRRYETANAVAMDLQRHLNHEPIAARPPSAAYRFQKAWRRNRIVYTAAIAVTLALVAAVSLAFIAYAARLNRLEGALTTRQAEEERDRVLETQRRQQRAREMDIPQIRQLIELERLVPAFQLAQQTKAVLPNDPALAELWQQLVTTTTVTTEPAGARVLIRDWNATEQEQQWFELGHSPLNDVKVPRSSSKEDAGVFRWRFEKPGYLARELNASAGQITRRLPIYMPEQTNAPDGMVYMPRKTEDEKLGEFWIDRCEVTHRQFKEFVDAGGYERREYWRHEFVQEGKTIPWKEAVDLFRDQTGKPGPATWVNGSFPDGETDYPVGGVSWHEAAAYAQFVGKSLPTVEHWGWAANNGRAENIVPLSNFSNRRSAPVGSHRGIGRFDVLDMAGNVKEWCWNESEDKRRCLRGGAWDDPPYVFSHVEARSPLDRSPQFGFRCVRYLQQPTAPLLSAVRTKHRDFAAETPATREQIEQYLRYYAYFRDAPLKARLRSSAETNDYRHETVAINGAYGEEFDVHLFLPHNGRPPYAPIVIVPDADAFGEKEFALPSTYTGRCVPGLLKEGWAICWPIYKATYERRRSGNESSVSPVDRDRFVQIAKDLSRTIDYLQTRGDMELERLAYFGVSWGASKAPIMLVVEPRFKAAILVAGGYGGEPKLPEVEPFQFAPYVKVPLLMINGRYDTTFPLESSQMTLYRDLGSADKQIKHLESGHAPPLEETIELANGWLRERLRKSATVHRGD